MPENEYAARIRATIEEELGTFRHFAELPSTEIEEMTARLMRAIDGFLGEALVASNESRAA